MGTVYFAIYLGLYFATAFFVTNKICKSKLVKRLDDRTPGQLESKFLFTILMASFGVGLLSFVLAVPFILMNNIELVLPAIAWGPDSFGRLPSILCFAGALSAPLAALVCERVLSQYLNVKWVAAGLSVLINPILWLCAYVYMYKIAALN